MTMNMLSELSLASCADDEKPYRLDCRRERKLPEVRSLDLVDVKVIRAPRISDSRGYFCETFQRTTFAAQGIENDFLQDNQSNSKRAGTIRGLHFQCPPFAQAKLVRVLCGRILDVAVDLRSSSPTFGRHVAVELNGDNDEQLLIPAGFAHGFCTLEPDTIVFYKVDQVYSAAHDAGVNWADPRLAIEWPVSAIDAILSDKDRGLPMLADLPPIFE
jgi:dTDP-4-dehydrorhamnose 3,5-epimerase